MVNVSKVSLKHIFGDKVDAGGNSAMFKLFDELGMSIKFTTFSNKEDEHPFSLYDAEYSSKYNIILKDKSRIYKTIVGHGFASEVRTKEMGSMKLVDEMKFFKNGKPVDPDGNTSYWQSGEYYNGLSDREDNNITNLPIDFDGWKDYVESYNLI